VARTRSVWPLRSLNRVNSPDRYFHSDKKLSEN
jgi:hypothetical protein